MLYLSFQVLYLPANTVVTGPFGRSKINRVVNEFEFRDDTFLYRPGKSKLINYCTQFFLNYIRDLVATRCVFISIIIGIVRYIN